MYAGGFYRGMGVGGWLLTVGFWVALLAVTVWTVAHLFPSDGQSAQRGTCRTRAPRPTSWPVRQRSATTIWTRSRDGTTTTDATTTTLLPGTERDL